MAADYSPELSIIDSLPPPPSTTDFPLGQLPPLLPVDSTPNDLSILNPLPPPMLPLDAYELQYGPSSSTEPQLDTPTQDGTIPSFDEMDEQYNFLRRTLSHSRGRYSARFKRPRPKPQSPERSDEQSSLDVPGKKREDLEYRIPPAPGKTSGPHPLAKHHTVRGTNVQGDYVKQSQHQRNIDRRSSPATVRNKHVDSLGRPYIVDHETHTVQYGSPTEEGSDNIPGSRGRREMLNRRYESLQRSFRSAHHQRRMQTANNLSPGESAGAISYLPGNRRDSNSDDVATPTPVANTSRGSNKKKSWWFSLGRNRNRTISQSAPEAQDSNIIPIVSPDILSPITPPPSLDDLGISLPPSFSSSQTTSITNGELEREPDLAGDSMRIEPMSQYRNNTSHDSVVAILDAMSTSQPHPPSTEQPRPPSSDQSSLRSTDQSCPQSTDQPRPQNSTPENQVPLSPTQRATDLDRMMQVQRKISQTRMSRRSQHDDGGDTDEETDERSTSPKVEPADTTNGGQASITRSGEAVQEEEEQQQQFDRQRGSKRKLSKGLTDSPALKFITRPDLYTFLNSAGEAGEEFISNRALVELVQRIRSQTNLFEKYQHSRHLVKALNRFVDEDSELPKGWEKKLNKKGKVFFIDHVNFITTFIDPRLPLDNDQSKTRKTSLPAPQNVRRVYSVSEEPELRGHHSTVVQTTSSPDDPVVTVENLTSNEHASYESQIVAFLRQSDVIDKINRRYRRGVKPSLAEAIEDIKANGVPGLERVQLAGGTAAYELGLILSMFDEEVNAMAPESNTTTATTPNITVTTSPNNTLDSTATLQRQKQAFSAKLQTFKLQLARLGFAQSSRLKFNLRRDHLLEDAYEHIMKSEIRHLQRKRLNIAFKGEEGLDYGGPSREFFFLVSREIFNPYFGIFEYSANDTYTVQISSTSCFIRNNLDWLRFAGRIIGLAIAQGFLLDVFFTRPFYKILLKRPPTLTDLESLEPAFYSSLLWIKDNDPAPLDLTFTVEEEAFGQLTTHELKEGGLDIPVLEENKKEYIELMLKWRLDRGTQDQSNALMKGFNEIMPVSLIQQFDAQELEFIIAGTLEIDIDDWRTNTDYRNGYHATHPVILWFWKAVEMFDNEQRLRLLQFITGTSSVPYEGFKALRGSSGPKRFTIDFFNDVRSLPRSHTCFNRLDLPPYPSFEILYEKLRVAVEEGGTFGAE